jgi:leucyl-tRNA synthetase
MFGFAFIEGGDWDDSGIAAMFRYLQRVHRFAVEHLELLRADAAGSGDGAELTKLSFVRHNSIKGATQDLERFQFNTAISRHMELTNALYAYANANEGAAAWPAELRECALDWIRLLAPLAPHLGEELWEMLGGESSVFESGWPAWDEASLKLDQITVVLQVNGKIREQMEVPRDMDRDALMEEAKAFGKIPQWIEGKEIRKVIVVPDKLVNIVVSG